MAAAGPGASTPQVQQFVGEHDPTGVWVYQAFNADIAEYAVIHQRLGGPAFKPERMTWIKPSFAWVLYRSGYARKHNQERILKLKVPHAAMAKLLAQCTCKHGGGGSNGRVQWDPARDLLSSEEKGKACLPRVRLRERAIQIGLRGPLSKEYVDSVVAIEDVTGLAHRVQAVHEALLCRQGRGRDRAKSAEAARQELAVLRGDLPSERPYMPACGRADLVQLGMAPGETADNVARLGLGKAAAA